MLKRRNSPKLALLAGLLLVAAACGGGGGGDEEEGGGLAACEDNPNTCNSGQVQQGGSMSFAIEKDIPNWNVMSADGNVFETGLVLTGVLPQAFYPLPDFSVAMNESLLASAEMTGADPQTVVYEIQPDAVWSDGTPITADDFIFVWKAKNGEDCPDCAADSTAGFDRIESIEGSNDGKTVTVTFAEPFTDWQNLFGGGDDYLYPAHVAEEQGFDLDTPKGLADAFNYFGDNVPDYSGGPFQIENFDSNVAVTLVPNPEWWGNGPNLDRLVFRVITDAAQEPVALQNDEVQAIYPQPEVDLVEQVDRIPNVDYAIGEGLTWEHFDFNLENDFLKDKALRQAMFTAIDRQAIIDKTVGQFTEGLEPLNSHNFVPGQEEQYEDVVSQTGQGNGDVEAAKQILTDAGYTIEGDQLMTPDGEQVPTFTIRYTTGNAIRQDQCELFAQQVEELGIDVEIQTTDDLGGTLLEGEYDIIVFAWVASPFPYANALQNWTTGQDSNFGNYSNEQVDDLIKEAASQTDPQRGAELLNEANAIMAEDAYVLPLYQKPVFLAVQDQYANIRINATNIGPPYNTEEWGIRQDAG